MIRKPAGQFAQVSGKDVDPAEHCDNRPGKLIVARRCS